MTPPPEDETQPFPPADAPARIGPESPVVPGHYVIERELGRGGMGAVWLARDTRLGRNVALKFPRAEHMGDPERLEAFTREARAASALNHPNIITIYEVGEHRGQHFIAMEYIDGVTLNVRAESSPISLAQVADIGRQITTALEAAHQAGIVHRDLKPYNIMIRTDGLVKVLDFGIAHMGGLAEAKTAQGAPAHAADQSETVTLGVIGTPLYMSPEQALGLPADARSDIFSLGVILYELIAGHRPFPMPAPGTAKAELLARTPPPLAPAAADAVLRKALSGNPEERHASAREFSLALQSLAAPPQAHAKSSWIAAALLIAVLVGVGFRYFASSAHQTGGPPPETVAFATFPGTKAYSSFSPDGNRIAFSWTGDPPQANGVRSIYIKSVGSDEPARLTAPSGIDEILPAWSPDGNQIAFWRGRDIFIAAAAPGSVARKIRQAGQGHSWSPDAKSLAIVSVPPGGWRVGDSVARPRVERRPDADATEVPTVRPQSPLFARRTLDRLPTLFLRARRGRLCDSRHWRRRATGDPRSPSHRRSRLDRGFARNRLCVPPRRRTRVVAHSDRCRFAAPAH